MPDCPCVYRLDQVEFWALVDDFVEFDHVQIGGGLVSVGDHADIGQIVIGTSGSEAFVVVLRPAS